MKNLYRILIALLAFSFIAVSCKNQEFEYIPGDPETSGCYGVYFPTQDASGSHTYDPTMERSVTITVSRTNSTGAITVPYTVTTSEDGVFNFGTINFADGQTETELLVTFPNAKVGVDYSFSVQIDDKQYASLYNEGAIALDFSVLIVEMVTLKDESGKPTKVQFHVNNDFLGDFGYSEASWDIEGTIQYYEVDGVRYGTVVPDQGGIWMSDAEIKFVWYPNQTYEIEDKTYQPVEVPLGRTGYELPGSEVGVDHPCAVLFSDYYHHYLDVKSNDLGSFLEFVAKYGESYKLSYYDGHGGFYFNLVYDIEGTNYWYGFCENSVVGIANGYLRVDYSLDLGTDYTVQGVTPIYVEAGVDVAKIKYAVYEGELTATQVGYKIEAITAGTEEGVVTFSDFEIDEEEAVKYATLGVQLDKTAEYTLVAVAYDDKDKPQNNASTTFRHIAAGDTEEYAVDINVLTEATPVRYTETGDYDQYTSFAFAVYGSDITEAHLAVVPTDKLSNSLLSTIKYNSEKYAVGEETLAAINGEGGYYDVASGLAANTEYAVVVWATNGSEDKFVYETFKTEKLPYVWKSLGKGTIVDGFCTPLFSKPTATATCDVYEEAKTPGFYMITGYQQEVAAKFFGLNKEDMAPYEGGNWKNTEVIVDATNPNKVVIAEQDYGVCVNQSYGFFLIETEPSGKLENGVITFPAEEVYIGIPGLGKWYITNGDGSFKITLPSAASTTAVKPVANSGNGRVEDLNIISGLRSFEKAKVQIERDAQAVNANVSVSYDRSTKASRALRESRTTTIR
jgi:hypothetical protein